MADFRSKKREPLKDYFEAGDIPFARHFAELIHSGINQLDDGIKKGENRPLEIQKPKNEDQDVILLYEEFPTQAAPSEPNWRIRLVDISSPTTTRGLSISEGPLDSDIRLFIQEGGNIGIGTETPNSDLQVVGELRADSLGGLINPTTGDRDSEGILFPEIEVDSIARKGRIQFFERGDGRGSNLEITVDTDDLRDAMKDHILLKSTGTVGVFGLAPDDLTTPDPTAKLHVDGDIKLEGTVKIRGSKQILFDQLSSTAYKVQLAEGYGFGVKQVGGVNALFYGANGKHAWLDMAGDQRMFLTTTEDGGLSVLGTGISAFSGTLAVNGADTSTIDHSLAIGKGEVSNGVKLEVEGNAKLNGDVDIPGRSRIRFSDLSFPITDPALPETMIQLQTGYELGVNHLDESLFYIAKTRHAWAVEDEAAEDRTLINRMILSTAANGGLSVLGTGQSSFAGTLAVNGTGISSISDKLAIGHSTVANGYNLDVNGSIKLSGDIQLPEAKKLQFSGIGFSDGLKIQFKEGYGLGINQKVLFYTADGEHAWRDKEGNKRMSLITKASGGLSVLGSGTSSILGSLAVGQAEVTRGFRLDVGGPARVETLSSGTVTATKLSMGAQSISERQLRALNDLVAGKARGTGTVNLSFPVKLPIIGTVTIPLPIFTVNSNISVPI